MGAFDSMGGPATGGVYGDPVNPNSKFADFDNSNLESLAAEEQAVLSACGYGIEL